MTWWKWWRSTARGEALLKSVQFQKRDFEGAQVTTGSRPKSNRKLISAVLREDVKALSGLYDLCVEVVKRYAHHIPSFLLHEPDDFAGDVFVALVKNECAALRRLRDPAALNGYIKEAFLNIVRMEIKKQPTPPPVSLEQVAPPEEPYLSTHDIDLLQVAASQVIACLPAKQRLAFSLWIEGRSYKEIADILGIPIGTVGTYVHRVKKKLRQELGQGS